MSGSLIEALDRRADVGPGGVEAQEAELDRFEATRTREPFFDDEPSEDLIDEALSGLAWFSRPFADAARLRRAADDELLQLAGIVADQAAVIQAQQALIAGEIAERSRVELGLRGLAQSLGHRTPAELVRVTTGGTLRDARATVEVGALLVETAQLADPATGEVPEPSAPWMACVADRVVAGRLSPEKATAIRRGLGQPGFGIEVGALAVAARTLLGEADALDADRLHARARELRDELDSAGVAEREAQRREQRSFRLHRQSDGMTRAVWLMDPETAAIVTDVVDRATSPKLGGPRFVRDDERERAERIERDPRTAEQYASDVLVELLRLGHAADPQLLGGDDAPAVRILVTRDDLVDSVGAAHVEGQTAPVSVATAERLACAGGHQVVVFDGRGRPLDVGRASRLFTRRQRRALGARDGGCMFPGCERPPSWTEAHHIRHWVRDRGGSDIDDGILLCRHHHRLVHDQGWEFRRRMREAGIEYALIPRRRSTRRSGRSLFGVAAPPTADCARRPASPPARIASRLPRLGPPMNDTLAIDALRAHGIHVLTDAGVLTPEADAELLLGHVLGLSRGAVQARAVTGVELTPPQATEFAALVARRAAREPLQHITGHAPFRSLDLLVGPGVFVPRPETETVAQLAIDALQAVASPEPVAVDLGTGSGAIALALATEVPHARVVAVERSPDAHAWAQRNVTALGSGNIRLVLGDLADAVPELDGLVDVVVSNPPYIPDDAIPRDPEVRLFDPDAALYGGADGLDPIRAISARAAALLRPGGLLVLEHGELQGAAVRELLTAHGWRAASTTRDLLGRDRATTALR